MENSIPLGRIARPDDIVKVIVFLASKRSEKITGQIIKVDGGRSLTSSGYVHYRGMKNMNARFEPDGPKLSTWFGDIFTRDKAVEELRKRYNEIVDNAKNYRDMTIQTTFHYDEVPTIRYDITEVIIPQESEDKE